MIKMRGITKYYEAGVIKTFVLRDIDLDIQQGEFVTVMGPSGAGKSTLLHILGMLDTSSAGEYLFFDQPVHRLAAYALALAVIAGGVATLPGYGVTCDEAYGNLFFGERYLHYFLTHDPAYLDFNNADLPIHHRQPNLFAWAWRNYPWVFPPLADTLSAGTMELLGHRLGWMDPIDGFHVATILLVGLLLVVLFEFAAPRIGPAAALAGVSLLAFHPRFWGDMHNNPKDIPQLVFFAFTIMAAARWYARPSVGRALLAGAAGGAALAIKVNAVFVPVVVVLGLWPWQGSTSGWRPVVDHLRRVWWHYGLMVFSAAVTLYAVWPWLHHNTLVRFGRHIRVFVTQGGRLAHPGWNPDPAIQLVVTMPELTLLLLAVGTLVALARVARGSDPSGTLRLLLAWMAVPVLRNSVPGAWNFDGIRHFYEFLPAAALLAAVGGATVVRLAGERKRLLAACALAAVTALDLGQAIVRYHPFETAYFNRLVGGLQGAARRFPEATDYWGSSYRQGVNWLNRNAEPGSALYVSVHRHILALMGDHWLRPDLRFIESSGYESALASGRPVYVMFVTRVGHYDEIAQECVRERRPVYQIVVDGHPILLIYRLSGGTAGATS